jgi:hypothetical protein
MGWDNSRRNQLFKGKTKGATDCSVAPGFVPSPRYFAILLLHQRKCCTVSAGR